MQHNTKNSLLKLFYKEASPQEELKLQKHLTTCEECREYMQFLNRMGMTLDKLPEERPLSNTFERIMENIPEEQPRTAFARPVISAAPFFQIAFSMVFIVLLIYFVQSKISLLPIWNSLQKFWLVDAIGSFGLMMLIFFAVGTFITLSLAPVLYFDLNKKALRF